MKYLHLIIVLILSFSIGGASTAFAQKKKKDKKKKSKKEKVAPEPVAETTSEEFKLENFTDSLSYLVGNDLGRNFKQQDLTIDGDALLKGIMDAMEGNEMMDQADAQAFMASLQQRLANQKAAGNRAKGEAFLKENATKEGVVVHESGLQYKVIREGTGASPTVADQVTIHYRGTLIDGTEFDSSYSRGEPTTFPLGNLIKAWQIALPLMKEGGKWEIYCPDNIAYGLQAPPSIGPGQTLIFEIELFTVGANK